MTSPDNAPSLSPSLSVDPAGDAKQGPLAPYLGAKPPAPAWFAPALAQEPERTFVTVAGAKIESLAWGARGKPGLLLMHGNAAHADWYSFIAPFFAERFRVASMSWSGMGGSDWRETYAVETFAEEALTVAREAGLFDGPVKPVFAAHSFGALTLRYLSVQHGHEIAGAIVLDSRTDMMGRPPPRPGETANRPGPPGAGDRTKPNNVYPTLEAALARFRLAPPQPCENHYLVDHIARLSLKRAPMPDGSGEGWTWKFDPFLFRNFSVSNPDALSGAPKCPLAMIWGARSAIIQMDRLGMMKSMEGRGPMLEIPDSGHHVMLDQPLALVTALDGLLQGWPNGWAQRP